jgi:hypothetical protein
MMATQLFVVPKSMPITFAMSFFPYLSVDNNESVLADTFISKGHIEQVLGIATGVWSG